MTTVRASIAILAAIVFAMPAALAATDVTSSLEYLFTPLGERYTGTGDSALHARGVHCLRYLDGRIFVGGGEWNDNTGPVPVYSITPGVTPSLAYEYTPDSEAIEDYYYTYRPIVDYSFTTNKSGEVSTNVVRGP